MWSATQYLAFEDERTRPVRDLLAALPMREADLVMDIGCGPGNSTELLVARFPNAVVTGIDSSGDMLKAARARLPEVAFHRDDIERWAYAPGNPLDVILANAVLQWVPEHARLLPALVTKLAPGGGLAVQMPDNLDQPTHRLMREVAADGPWAAKLSTATAVRTLLPDAQWYFELLRSTGCRADVWRTTYYHPLAGGAVGIVEWLKGSGLRPFLEPLDRDLREQFLERYQEAVARAYRALPDGTVLLPFPRLFLTAVR